EHLHGLLPGRASRRLCLRARELGAARRPTPDAPPPGAHAPAFGRAAARRESCPAPTRRGQSDPRRAPPPLPLRGLALPRRQRHRAAPPEVVQPHRAWGGERSLLPVRSEQSREHARSPRLPDPDRAATAPARRGLADPNAPLERGLLGAPRPHRAVRPRSLAARPAGAASG